MKLRPLPSTVAVLLGMAALGCSDAPARPAKLGLNLTIRNPDSTIAGLNGRSCPSSTGVTWDIGKASHSSGVTLVDSPNSTSSGTTLEDGKSDASISCTVRKTGAFEANGGGTDPQITPPNGLINFTLSGTAKKGGASNNAAMSIYTPVTLAISSAPGFPGCTMSHVYELDSGALWADIDCPALIDTSSSNVACHAFGTIVLEYCKTGEEED